jgi:hypothetical protein
MDNILDVHSKKTNQELQLAKQLQRTQQLKRAQQLKQEQEQSQEQSQEKLQQAKKLHEIKQLQQMKQLQKAQEQAQQEQQRAQEQAQRAQELQQAQEKAQQLQRAKQLQRSQQLQQAQRAQQSQQSQRAQQSQQELQRAQKQDIEFNTTISELLKKPHADPSIYLIKKQILNLQQKGLPTIKIQISQLQQKITNITSELESIEEHKKGALTELTYLGHILFIEMTRKRLLIILEQYCNFELKYYNLCEKLLNDYKNEYIKMKIAYFSDCIHVNLQNIELLNKNISELNINIYNKRSKYIRILCNGIQPIPTDIKHNGRIYALSDIHGDMHSFIIALRDCAKVIKKRHSPLLTDIEILLNIDINIKANNEAFDPTFGYEWCGDNSIVVICGDIIDPIRGDTKNCYRNDTNNCTDYPQIEIKILKFINALNKQAIENKGRIYKLLGNHEFNNIYGNYNGDSYKNYRFNGPTHTYENVRRNELFHYNKPGYNLLFEDNCYALLKINNTIFVHGELPIAGTINDMILINTAINRTSILNNNIGTFDWLDNRNWGSVQMITTRNHNGTTDMFCNDIIKKRLMEFMNTPNIDNLRVVIGHCVQSSCTNQCKLSIDATTPILDINGNLQFKECFNTTFDNKKAQDDVIIVYDGTSIYSGSSSPNNQDKIFGITMQCQKNQQSALTPADFFVYNIDIGSSRAFDSSSINMIQKLEEENYFLFSRTPQILLIDNKDVIYIIKSKMKNTRIHQPRPQYEQRIKRLSEEFKLLNHTDHELSLDNARYLKKYLKYKHKYLLLK